MKQRILFITPSLFKGGAETQLLKVARFFKSQQNEVMIISLKPINFFDADLEQAGIAVVFLKDWRRNFISNNLMLFKMVRAYKADVVIAFMFIAILFARLLKLLFKFKLVSTIRISVIKKKWYLPFKATRGLDDAVVYNSYASKINFEQQKLVSRPGIVINNGVNVPSGHHSHRTMKSPDCFVWVCIAHFKYNKDYQTLFRAISLLKGSQGRRIRLDVVGNLHGQEWPAKMIETLGIEPYVRLLGHQQDSTSYLESADAFVLSSFSEGMPNSVLEAMAYGKAVVVTDIDCNRELVKGGDCGFLFKQGDTRDLATQMNRLMNCTLQQRETLGGNGRRYITTNFAEGKVMLDWQAVIDCVAENKINHLPLLSAGTTSL